MFAGCWFGLGFISFGDLGCLFELVLRLFTLYLFCLIVCVGILLVGLGLVDPICFCLVC